MISLQAEFQAARNAPDNGDLRGSSKGVTIE